MRIVFLLWLLFIPLTTGATEYTAFRVEPENIGLFYKNKVQQFTAYGLSGTRWTDITKNVDWFIEENGFPDQPSGALTINQNGLAEALASWGRANVSFCFPRGCRVKEPEKPKVTDCLPSVYYLLSDAKCIDLKLYAMPSNCRSLLLFGGDTEERSLAVREKASTTLTIMDVVKWKAPLAGDTSLPEMPVKSLVKDVSITESRITWAWQDGFDGLLWAFYSEDGNQTYTGWGWDYVTKNHYMKALGSGYPRGWVGTAVAACAKCDGYPQRTTVFFTETY